MTFEGGALPVLIVGFGSIGSRHALLLREMGAQVILVSARNHPEYRTFPNISSALAHVTPKFVFICNQTASHIDSLNELAQSKFSGHVLVEKPLFSRSEVFPEHQFQNVFVAYNLRFHPVVARAKEIIAGEKILSSLFYVGQYLPLWRPQLDYRKSYSAKAGQGGGALLDLSHELDLAQFLVGKFCEVNADVSHVSHLEIDSDDVCLLMLKNGDGVCSQIQMNYLDRITQRFFVLNTENLTIRGDLIRNELQVNERIERLQEGSKATYFMQTSALMSGQTERLCTLEEGQQIMRICDSARISSREKMWVTL